MSPRLLRENREGHATSDMRATSNATKREARRSQRQVAA
jgi:hypothetical protein